MSIFVKPEDVTMFQQNEYKINVLKNAIDALELLMKNGVEEHLENEFSTVKIEDWIEELKAVYNYEPSNEPTSAQFERDGGYGLSDAERNK